MKAAVATKTFDLNKDFGFKIKKHLIHVLVAGAMAVSWGAVSHVNTYMHNHLQTTPAVAKAKSKSKSKSSQGQTTMLPEETVGPTPVPEMPASHTMAMAQPIKPAQVKAKAPAQAQVKAKKATPTAAAAHAAAVKASSSDLAVAVAAKAGISIVNTQVDTSFIRKVEGSALKGYVPLATTTNSGVTIGDGFDLGQMKPAEFNKLAISDVLKGKLRPYVGLTRLNAKAYVKAHPLTINEDELKEVNIIAANKILVPLVKEYNKASGKSFTDLPAGAQTALFSYAYQHGPGFMHSSSGRELWNSFITQNFQKARSLLMSAKMYAPRRHMEAHLLDNL